MQLPEKPRFLGIASGYTLGFFEFWTAAREGGQAWSKWWDLFLKDVSRMKEIKATWVLWWLVWFELEPQKGQFQHFDKLHAVLDVLKANDIEPIFNVLHSAPVWHWPEEPAFEGEESYPPNPARLDEFEESLERVAAEFGSKVKQWKVLEEQNVMFYGGLPVQEQAELYAQVLGRAYGILKRVIPGAKVISGGVHVDQFLAPEAKYLEYVEALVAELTRISPRAPLCDVIAMHQHRFPYGPLEVNPYSGRTMMEEINDLLAIWDRSKLYRGKKLWITNLSWPAIGTVERRQEAIVSEQMQALFAEEAWKLLRPNARIERWGWVDLRDPAYEVEPEFEAHYGLVRANGTEKPAYGVFKRLAL